MSDNALLSGGRDGCRPLSLTDSLTGPLVSGWPAAPAIERVGDDADRPVQGPRLGILCP